MFLVHLRRAGREWDPAKPMEEQSGWDEHAAFIDGLVEQGVIVLGGPLDDVRVAHAMEAPSEDAIRAVWVRDPWWKNHLVLESIEPWDIRLDGRER